MSDYSPQKVRDVFSYVERLNALRGELINATVNLEAIINTIIASHFCTDTTKRTELLALIIRRRLNFEIKLRVFRTLIETHYNNLLKEAPDLFAHFKEIQVMRNKLAHLHLHTDLETISKNLQEKKVEFLDEFAQIQVLNEADILKAIKLAKHYEVVFSLRMFRRSSAT
jgi:hypothetical protein